MSNGKRGIILVGIDDSEEASAALRYAVHVAERVPSEILLAHAYETWPEGTFDPQVDELRRRCEDDVARLLAAAAERIPPTVPVRTAKAAGRPRPFLRGLAEQARLVVVGQDTTTFLDRLSYGSVAAHLAATSPCPVAVVPAGWHPKLFGEHPVVAVASEDAESHVISVALDEAARIGRGVVVLHPVPYLAGQDEIQRSQAAFAEILPILRSRHPTVPVTTRVVRGDADERVAQNSLDASAVVVGRPPGHRIATWRKSVAHAIVRRTRCPLIVVPPTHTEDGEPIPVQGSAQWHAERSSAKPTEKERSAHESSSRRPDPDRFRASGRASSRG